MAGRGFAAEQLGVGAVLPAGSADRRTAGVRAPLSRAHRRLTVRLPPVEIVFVARGRV